MYTVGTLLNITFLCTSCKTQSKWDSQPYIGHFPAVNILLSAGILFAGTSANKVLRALNSIGVATYHRRTFFRHQKHILNPAIGAVFANQQERILTVLKLENSPLVIGGDGRADSPGHSAKFGTYTMMDLDADLVLEVEQMQVSVLLGTPLLVVPLC